MCALWEVIISTPYGPRMEISRKKSRPTEAFTSGYLLSAPYKFRTVQVVVKSRFRECKSALIFFGNIAKPFLVLNMYA